jgi:hypothetical protein
VKLGAQYPFGINIPDSPIKIQIGEILGYATKRPNLIRYTYDLILFFPDLNFFSNPGKLECLVYRLPAGTQLYKNSTALAVRNRYRTKQGTNFRDGPGMDYKAELITGEHDIEALQIEGEWVQFLLKGRYKWVHKTRLEFPHFNPEPYKRLPEETVLKGSGRDRSTAGYEKYLSFIYESETVYAPERGIKRYEENMFEWGRYFNRLDTEIKGDSSMFFRGMQEIAKWVTKSSADNDGDIIYNGNPPWMRETPEFRKFKRTIVCKHPLEFDRSLYTDGEVLKKLVQSEFGWPKNSDKGRYFKDEVKAVDIWGDIAGKQIGGVRFRTNSFWFAHPVYFLNHLYKAGLLDGFYERYLTNLREDKTLKLTDIKKETIIGIGRKMFEEKYEPAFVAGILANILYEGGTAGIFESSNYTSGKPSYLEYMDADHDYRNTYSGQNITDKSLSTVYGLLQELEKKGWKQGKFGLGSVQWTAGRTKTLVEVYREVVNPGSDRITFKQAVQSEALMVCRELKEDAYAKIHDKWLLNNTGNPDLPDAAYDAGVKICLSYEKPAGDPSRTRGKAASQLYEVMAGK